MTAASERGGAPPWWASIDPRLVARLSRSARPGLIAMGLARRIVGGVEAITGRLTLLARFPQLTERTGTEANAIVHVQPAPAPAEPVPVTAVTERILQVVTSRVVERDRVIERTLVERVSVPVAPSAPSAAVQPSMPAAAAPSPRVDSIASFAPGSQVRRTRMGAPLARPLPQHSTATVARAAHTLTNHASPVLLSSAAPVAPATVRPRAAALASARVDRHQPANAAPASVVAPNRSAPRSPRTAVVVPQPIASVAAQAAPREPIVAPRRAPVAARASSELLAHVAPRPVAPPHAAPQPAPRPAPAAAPASAPVRAAPRADAAALRRTDLPEIAAQVQHILARQATIDRARRGLRR